jgi:hypothetical protein
MNAPATAQNLIEVLMQRFEAEQLDRVLALWLSVDAGETLTDY